MELMLRACLLFSVVLASRSRRARVLPGAVPPVLRPPPHVPSASLHARGPTYGTLARRAGYSRGGSAWKQGLHVKGQHVAVVQPSVQNEVEMDLMRVISTNAATALELENGLATGLELTTTEKSRSVHALLNVLEAVNPPPIVFDRKALVGDWQLEQTEDLPIAVRQEITQFVEHELIDISVVLSISDDGTMITRAEITRSDGEMHNVTLYGLMTQMEQTSRFAVTDEEGDNMPMEISYLSDAMLVLRKGRPKHVMSNSRAVSPERPGKASVWTRSKHPSIQDRRPSGSMSLWRFGIARGKLHDTTSATLPGKLQGNHVRGRSLVSMRAMAASDHARVLSSRESSPTANSLSTRAVAAVQGEQITVNAGVEGATLPGVGLSAGAQVLKVGSPIVKIFTTTQRVSMVVPWQRLQVESSSGSGTFIRRRDSLTEATDGGALGTPQESKPPYWHFKEVEQAIPKAQGDLILTAAHVVANARDVRVQLLASTGASPEKYAARVIAVAHECDLALLEVMDDACFKGVEPMPLLGPDQLPQVQSKVQVMGFPVGGDYLSITEGVLSRVEVVEYSHGRRPCLALTVDAAINSGNSGGPVVDPASGKLVAVAHQKVVAVGVENQGHAVPSCLIWRFLYGQAHGRLLSMPSLGGELQHLENYAHRQQLGLAKDEKGVLLKRVGRHPGEDEGELRVGDVLTRVNGHDVDNAATVQLLGHRVAMSASQDLLYIGDTVSVTVRRQNKVEELMAKLGGAKHLVPRSLYGEKNDVTPQFMIFGGLVFIPLTAELLDQAWPNTPDIPDHLMNLYHREVVQPTHREAVILMSILAHDVNAGYGSSWVGAPIVESVGGTRVRDLRHLAELVREAQAAEDFIVFDMNLQTGPFTIVLKSADIPEADREIMALYGLPSLVSEGL